jgi:hypothetical protein
LSIYRQNPEKTKAISLVFHPADGLYLKVIIQKVSGGAGNARANDNAEENGGQHVNLRIPY